MTKSTIKDFFKDQFRTDIEKMIVMTPINVSEANIGILGHNFKTGKDELTKVNFIIKKQKDKLIKIKTKSCEEEVGFNHLFYNGISFIELNKFKIGDDIQTKYGLETVLELNETNEDFIYDVETELHNFYSNGLLSHNTPMSHLPNCTGGEAPKFFASVVNRVTKTDVLKDGDGTIGISIRVRNYKNKAGVPFRDANMNLYYNGGFKSDEEYIDFLLAFEIIKQKGAYFYVPGEEKSIQGRVKLIEWLNSNPDKYAEWKSQVDDLLTQEGKLDLNKEEIGENYEEESDISTVEISEDDLLT